jgi:hypothetical protein
MQAIVQDRYGSADVLQLREIEKPLAGDDDVLVRVHAAGLHIGDWHLMTGRPYLMRIMGFGLRAPQAPSAIWKRDTLEEKSSSPCEGRPPDEESAMKADRSAHSRAGLDTGKWLVSARGRSG